MSKPGIFFFNHQRVESLIGISRPTKTEKKLPMESSDTVSEITI